MSKTNPKTIGLDISNKLTHVHVLDETGKTILTDRVETCRDVFAIYFAKLEPCRVILEAGTDSMWMAELLADLEYEVLVADPRQIPMITSSKKKTDRNDAKLLAEYGQKAPELLHPIKPRPRTHMEAQSVLRIRDQLVKARTGLVLVVRNTLKTLHGVRLKAHDADQFAKKVANELPEGTKEFFEPVIGVIQTLTKAIKKMDARIEAALKTTFPEAERLRQVSGVGPITALAVITTIVSPDRFEDPRKVPVYIGLAPGCDNSGTREKQLGITKAGSATTRRNVVHAANYLLFRGPDSDLKRFGQRLIARGGRGARKKAAIAVARKLTVLLFVLWRDGTKYEPLKNSPEPADTVANPASEATPGPAAPILAEAA